MTTSANVPGEIKTISGNYVNILDFKKEDFNADDTISVLCWLCRFLGHSPSGYSIGVHSIIVALKVWKKTYDPRLTIAALFHEAAEPYIGDIPSPIKYLPEYEAVRVIENHIEYACYEALGVADLFKNPEIKLADIEVYKLEAYIRDLAYKVASNPFDRTTQFLISYQSDVTLFKNIYETLTNDQLLPPEVMLKMDEYCTLVDKSIKALIKEFHGMISRKELAEVAKIADAEVARKMAEVNVI